MMRRFFRALEREGAGYLLISGQACVLYGAAEFTEDVDLWVRPTARDLAALTSALREVGARAHKLTPPLEVGYLKRGHGFHVTIPGRADEAFLDVMGRPPRVGSFARSLARAEVHRTDWGQLPVVSVEDLVELKKTRRPRDYDVISNLARIRLEVALRARADRRTLRRVTRFALESSFRLDTLLAIYVAAPDAQAEAARASRGSIRALGRVEPERVREGDLPEGLEERLLDAIALETAALQKADLTYWRPVVDELRELRRRGALLIEGTPV